MDGRGDHGGSVAIIGMACRFPGARDPAEFYDLAVAGRRMFQPTAALPGRPLRAAVLDWAMPQIAADDPLSGDFPPRDLGPVRKLAAEMTALALIDAGLHEVAGTSRTGLVIAGTVPGLDDLLHEELGFAARGSFPPAARVSSLHAVAAAATALQAGQLDLAVAGGAELGLDPVWLALQARAGTLATDEMRVYAADPAGLLPGEGCGMVVLVRAADARTAEMPVYAEIAGWSTVRATAPELAGPDLARAYQQAGADPADVQLIEGHGPGTAAGDGAELAMLTRLRQGGRGVAALGAVSAGIGYARAAAGVASLVKAAAAMAAGTIPPGPGCAQPHPLVASGEARLRLPAAPEPWPDGQRLAAVNSLGTADPAVMAAHPGLRDAEGMHLVLRREIEPDHATGRPGRPASGGRAARESRQPRLFVLRDGDPGTLADQLDVIAGSAAMLSDDGLDRLARELAIGAAQAGQHEHQEHPAPLRVALTAASARRLADQAAYAARWLRAAGSAWGAGTARLLRTDELAGEAADVRITAGAGGTVVVLFPGRPESAAGQPALFAASLQALGTLDALGVRPAAGVGYGLAEITGLAWAGCIATAEAARLVAQCGQVLRACSCGTAAMARVLADAETAGRLGAAGHLHVAAYEGPRTHVLAGSTADIRELTRRAAMHGIAVEVLDGGKGSTPMHSRGMARCAAPLRSVFAGTSFAPPRRRLVSTITGRLITPDDDLAGLLAGQVTRPVLFAQAMTQAAGQADLIVTAGPDAGLAARAAECGGVPAVPVPVAMAAPGRAGTMLTQALAALFAAGALTDLTPFLGPGGPFGPFAPFGPSGGTLARRTVPRMRDAEPPPGPPPGPGLPPSRLATSGTGETRSVR